MTTSAPSHEYRAAMLGATGAVGSAVVREVLASPRWLSITALVRRASPELGGLSGAAEKLSMRVVSMKSLEADTTACLAALPPHTAAFCTLGIGQPRKVSAEEHWRVDVEYIAAFARACHAAGIENFSLLTSVGADVGSGTRYLHVKGAVEVEVRAIGFRRTSFFRPSVLVTKEIRYGLQDRITQLFFPLVSHVLPSRYHEITVDNVARAMRLNAERPATDTVEILHYADMQNLLNSATPP